MVRLFIELLFAFGWLGFILIGTLMLFSLRMLIRALTLVFRGFAGGSRQPPLFRGKGNDRS